MIILSVCLAIWFGYGLLNSSVLSYEVNEKMVTDTTFTEDVTSEIASRYNTKLSELSFDETILLSFVEESGLGVLGYILSEYEEMPSVDVSFLKEYVASNVTREEASKFYGNVDVAETIEALRMVAEGESISNAITTYLESKNLSVDQNDIDMVTKTFLENKDLDDESLKNKIITEIAFEKLNLNDMTTELSLQELFDTMMTRNPFTIVKDLLIVVNRNVYGYMLLTMVLIFLMIVVGEFRFSAILTWLSLSLFLAIMPLQTIRLIDFIVDRDLFTVFNGMESYKNYMLDAAITQLNLYTIVSMILILVLFVLSKVFRKRVDTKDDHLEEKKKSRYGLVRFGIVLILLFGLFLNGRACYNYNMTTYDEIASIKPSDLDPKDMDETLSELLNIEYDF